MMFSSKGRFFDETCVGEAFFIFFSMGEFQFLCGGFSKIFRFFEVSDDEAEGKADSTVGRF